MLTQKLGYFFQRAFVPIMVMLMLAGLLAPALSGKAASMLDVDQQDIWLHMEIFARAEDGQSIWHRWNFNETWSDWESLGIPPGGAMSAPSAVSWGYGRVDVFVLCGVNPSSLCHAWFDQSDGQGWHEWESWGNPGGSLLEGVEATSRYEGRLDVFAIGANRKIYQINYYDGELHNWRQFLDVENAHWGISAAWVSNDELEILYNVHNEYGFFQLERILWNARSERGSTEPVVQLDGEKGSSAYGSDAAYRPQPGTYRVEVYMVETPTGEVWQSTLGQDGASWGLGVVGEGTPAVFEPAAVSSQQDRIDLFIVGQEDRKLYFRTFSPEDAKSGDLTWTPFGDTVFTSGPAVISWTGPRPQGETPQNMQTISNEIQINATLDISNTNRVYLPLVSRNKTVETENEALKRDAEMYAAQFGVSLEEALRRLALQQEAGKLQAELSTSKTDTFAGMWLEHEPEFQVVVQFTDTDEKESINAYIANNDLASVISVRTAGLSLAELEEKQAAIIASMDHAEIPFDTEINIQENCVEVYVTEQSHLEDTIERELVQVSSGVKVITVPTLSESLVGTSPLDNQHFSADTNPPLAPPIAEIYGGIPIYLGKIGEDGKIPDYYFCTTAFTVLELSSLTKGVATAGHCTIQVDAPDAYYNNSYLPYQNGEFGGKVDAQWRTAPEYILENKINVGPGQQLREISYISPYKLTVVGSWQCKFGAKTGFGCGTVSKIGCRPDAIPNAKPVFVKLTADYHLAEPGDSGGPIFFANTAIGIMSAQSPDFDAFYMPIDFLSEIGVAVLGPDGNPAPLPSPNPDEGVPEHVLQNAVALYTNLPACQSAAFYRNEHREDDEWKFYNCWERKDGAAWLFWM